MEFCLREGPIQSHDSISEKTQNHEILNSNLHPRHAIHYRDFSLYNRTERICEWKIKLYDAIFMYFNALLSTHNPPQFAF